MKFSILSRVSRNTRLSLTGNRALLHPSLRDLSAPPPPGHPSSATLPGRLGGEEGRFRPSGARSGKLGRAPLLAARDRAKEPRDPRHPLGAAPASLSPVSPSAGDAPTPGDCRSPRQLPGGFWGGRRQGTPAGWPLPAAGPSRRSCALGWRSEPRQPQVPPALGQSRAAGRPPPPAPG